MASINRVVLVGNLTRDPELRHTPSGTAVCDLGLAVNDRVKQGDEWVDEVSFFDITVWAGQAESCAKYLAKGRPVAIDGRLKQDTWEKDGQKRSKVKIIAQNVQFLGSRQDNSGSEGAPVSAGAPSGLTPDTSDFDSSQGGDSDDDIPF